MARLKGSSQRARRARILLKVEAGGPGWTDRGAADPFDCRVRTVEKVRPRRVLEGFELALNGRARDPKVPRKPHDGQPEAQLIALRLGPPPKGDVRWSPRLLARQAVELEIIPALSRPTVANTLRRNGITGPSLQHWTLPAPQNGAFAARRGREDALAACARPYDAERPVIRTDGQPVQLVRETRQRLPATGQLPERVDCQCERAGTAALSLFSEPLAGWRQVTARQRRIQRDCAEEVAALLEGRSADCERVTRVLDNLSTHPPGAFHEAIEPQRARQLAQRIGCCFTPQHGSWLKAAEVELSALSRQRLGQLRIGEPATFRSEIDAGSMDVNHRRRGVSWHLTIDDARSKWQSAYPKLVT